MDTSIIFAIIALSVTALVFAVIIYFVEQKFKVIEDPRIDIIQELLPGANCGGCGYAGCRNFAEILVKSTDISSLNCPVGGNNVMTAVAVELGLESIARDPMIAVVRCNGTRENAKHKVEFDGVTTCIYAHSLFSGESGCPFGCLGYGDCVRSCTFDAIYIDNKTGLPIVSNDKCVACGACVKACPRSIIELRIKGKKDRRIYVNCINKEKGAIAKKNCDVACIGCGKCVKVCSFDAIQLEDNLAYIDFSKCTSCRKCVEVCPTNSIEELNFPPRKEKPVLVETIEL